MSLHPIFEAALAPFAPAKVPGELRVCHGADYDAPGAFCVERWHLGAPDQPGVRGDVWRWVFFSGPHTEARARWIARTENAASIRAA